MIRQANICRCWLEKEQLQQHPVQVKDQQGPPRGGWQRQHFIVQPQTTKWSMPEFPSQGPPSLRKARFWPAGAAGRSSFRLICLLNFEPLSNITPRFWSSGFRKEAREVCYSSIQHRWGAKENIFHSAVFQCRKFFSHHFMWPTQSVSVLTPVLLGYLIRNRGSIILRMQTDISVIIPEASEIRVFANVAEMWCLFPGTLK